MLGVFVSISPPPLSLSLSLSSRFKEVAAECTAAKIGFAEFCYLFVGIPVGQQASCSFGLGGTTSAPPQLL